MRIGMTYDLREDYRHLDDQETAEFDRADTIDGLAAAIRAMGHEADRIGNVRALMARLEQGQRWDLVFNIAEGLSSTGIAREAQVPMLLDLYGVPYVFSDPMVCSLTLHKAMTKRIVRDLGLPTPDFDVIERLEDVRDVGLNFPVFAKPVAEGSSKGVSGKSLARTRAELEDVCAVLLRQFRQPVLVETYLPGRELTVGIVGTGDEARAIGAMEVHLKPGAEAGAYSYANKEDYTRLVSYSLAEGRVREEAFALALAAWRGLGCRDGGRIDVRADDSGRLNFIEVNVLPGLNPVRSDLPILCGLAGVAYNELISSIIQSACRRLPVAPPVVQVRHESRALPR